jgi:carboxylesterase type B
MTPGKKILDSYPRKDFASDEERWMMMMSHLAYKNNTDLFTGGLGPCQDTPVASAYAEFSQLPTYAYSFQSLGPVDLIQHSMEFAPIFGWDLQKAHKMMPAYNVVNETTWGEYVNLFSGYWTNFAASANPNGSDLPTWNTFANGDSKPRTIRGGIRDAVEQNEDWTVLLIGGPKLAETVRRPWYQEKCELWQQVMTVKDCNMVINK